MDPSTTMLPDLLDDYCTWLRSWGASASTIKVRVSVLSRALVETDATTEGLTAWLARYDAPWTRSTYFSHLRSFFSWAHDAGHLPTDPTGAMRRPKTAKTLPRPLTDDQLEAVLAATTGKVHTYCLLGAFAGLRAHEVAKIAGEDVSAETIYVYGKGGQAAYVPTHPAIWEAAQDYPRRGLWFPSPSREGRPVTATAVSLAVSAVFRDLGIEGSHHRLRHTYGTTLLRRGANLRVVQELMRHQSLAATQVYTAVSAQERTAAILSLTETPSVPDPPRLRAVA